MGPGKLVRHMQNLSYTYDTYLICIGLGPTISSVICKNLSYSGPSYPSSPVVSSGILITRKRILVTYVFLILYVSLTTFFGRLMISVYILFPSLYISTRLYIVSPDILILRVRYVGQGSSFELLFKDHLVAN